MINISVDGFVQNIWHPKRKKNMLHVKREEKSQSEETNQPSDQVSYRTEILELSGKEIEKPP